MISAKLHVLNYALRKSEDENVHNISAIYIYIQHSHTQMVLLSMQNNSGNVSVTYCSCSLLEKSAHILTQ